MRSFPTKHSKLPRTGFILPIAFGLLVAQIIATGFVFRSNLHLHAALSAIGTAGYLTLPNPAVAATLKNFGPAFWGGLFFTLSIGTGLTLATWAVVYLWNHWLQRQRHTMIGILIGWVVLLWLVNVKGPVLFPSLFCLLVPLATGWACLRLGEAAERRRSASAIIPVLALVALTALWSTQLDKQLFTGIRDHILLSNPVGRSVNDFYYRYTLYAAEAFKSFGQKTLKTAHINDPGETAPLNQLERKLVRHDVLVVPAAEAPDVSLVLQDDAMRLEFKGKAVVTTTLAQFLKHPADLLDAYSQAIDRYGYFRKFTLIGLLVGFPVLLYVLVYAAIKTGARLILDDRKALAAASALCVIIGILLFLPMLKARPVTLSEDAISEALTDPQWTRRLAALRQIHADQMDIARYPEYLARAQSPLVVERYWLARAMAHSRSDAAYQWLLVLMRDAHPNVVCQAYYALGRHGRRAAVTPILQQMAQSSHWYTQWYGYGALKRLGWHQKRSR